MFRVLLGQVVWTAGNWPRSTRYLLLFYTIFCCFMLSYFYNVSLKMIFISLLQSSSFRVFFSLSWWPFHTRSLLTRLQMSYRESTVSTSAKVWRINIHFIIISSFIGGTYENYFMNALNFEHRTLYTMANRPEYG